MGVAKQVPKFPQHGAVERTPAQEPRDPDVSSQLPATTCVTSVGSVSSSVKQEHGLGGDIYELRTFSGITFLNFSAEISSFFTPVKSAAGFTHEHKNCGILLLMHRALVELLGA